MQGGKESGRGVYVVRRILAVLVILLLLALLIPQACQAYLGLTEGTGSGVQDTADIDSSGDGGSDQESAANGETAGVADDVAEQEDDTDKQSDSGETGASDGAWSTSGGVVISEKEYGGVENIELDAGLGGASEVLEEVAVGYIDQTAPLPVFDVGSQQPIEPIVPVGQPVFAEPIAVEDPGYYEYLAYYEDPGYYEYLAYYEDPGYYEYSAYYEEQSLEEPDPLGTYDTATFDTAGEEEGGGYGAYAAISAD
jgi:hypothetical protein